MANIYIHPLAEYYAGDKTMNSWGLASLLANVASERLLAGRKEEISLKLKTCLRVAGMPISETEKLIDEAKQSNVAIEKLIVLCHQGFEIIAEKVCKESDFETF